MRFGVREICDVVLKAKTAMKVGNKVFYKNEPVCYFDSLKTSSLESQSNAVYATGGRGNARLVSWEGERTVTFTMEDALISPISFSILSGAGVIDASNENKIHMHTTEQTDKVVVENDNSKVTIQLSNKPFVRGNLVMNSDGSIDYQAQGPSDTEDFIYVMLLDDLGEVISEPYIASEVYYTPATTGDNAIAQQNNGIYPTENGSWNVVIFADESAQNSFRSDIDHPRKNDISKFKSGQAVLVDYYVEKTANAKQINIAPETFGGNFYLEASTLFRTTQGVDVPAEFVIPNCKVQSNFTFTMAATGDPSTFTFTMDAFPDYTRWDKTKKVFASIIFADDADDILDFERLGTSHNNAAIATDYNTDQKPHIEDPRRTKE